MRAQLVGWVLYLEARKLKKMNSHFHCFLGWKTLRFSHFLYTILTLHTFLNQFHQQSPSFHHEQSHRLSPSQTSYLCDVPLTFPSKTPSKILYPAIPSTISLQTYCITFQFLVTIKHVNWKYESQIFVQDRFSTSQFPLPTSDFRQTQIPAPKQVNLLTLCNKCRGVGFDSSWVPPWPNSGTDGAGTSSSISSVGFGGVQLMMRQLASVREGYAQGSLDSAASWNLWPTHEAPASASASASAPPPSPSPSPSPSSLRFTRNTAGLRFRNTAAPVNENMPELHEMVDRVREVLPHIPDEVIIEVNLFEFEVSYS